jgi:hypothetical protein
MIFRYCKISSDKKKLQETWTSGMSTSTVKENCGMHIVYQQSNKEQNYCYLLVQQVALMESIYQSSFHWFLGWLVSTLVGHLKRARNVVLNRCHAAFGIMVNGVIRHKKITILRWDTNASNRKQLCNKG